MLFAERGLIPAALRVDCGRASTNGAGFPVALSPEPAGQPTGREGVTRGQTQSLDVLRDDVDHSANRASLDHPGYLSEWVLCVVGRDVLAPGPDQDQRHDGTDAEENSTDDERRGVSVHQAGSPGSGGRTVTG